MLIVSLLVRWILLAVAVILAAWTTPDIEFSGGLVSALIVSALIAGVNVVAHLIVGIFPTTDNVFVAAALTLAVNAFAVWVASGLTTRLRIDGFVAAVAFAMMVTLFSVVIQSWISRLLDRYGQSGQSRTNSSNE